MLLSAFLHFIAPCVFFSLSFNECCFALCRTSRLQFGIWESWLDSNTVVTPCLLLIKAGWRAEWVLGGGKRSAVAAVAAVFVVDDVLVLEVNEEVTK